MKKIIFVVIVILLVAIICFAPKANAVSSANIEDNPNAGCVVVLDAGHGGVDPGGIGISTKAKESNLNLAVVNKLKQLLCASGIQVVLTRTDENGLYGIYSKGYKKRDLEARKKIILDANPNLFVSVHMNRFTDKSRRGAQVFYNENSETGKRFAEIVQKEFEKKLPCSDKHISIGDYYMLKCSDCPSILAECGYLSNKEDEALLVTDKYQEQVAYAIFCGIMAYLSIG